MIFILSEVQLAENLGAVARVMKNFGQSQMRLINPKIRPDDPQAIATSTGAEDILDSAVVFDSFEDAVADITMLYGTCAETRDMVKPYIPPKAAVTEIAQNAGKTAILFGPERTGLDNELTTHCQAIIQIPTNPEFSSLNLAQAVSLVAYELYQSQAPIESSLRTGESSPATQEDLSYFFTYLESTLDNTIFFRKAEKKPVMWRNLRNIFTRAQLTEQETRTLHGMVKCLSMGESNDRFKDGK